MGRSKSKASAMGEPGMCDFADFGLAMKHEVQTNAVSRPNAAR
jgi:hypothetical protein